MFKRILSFLCILSLGLVAGFDIFEECVGYCEEIVQACNAKSGACWYFENYIMINNLTFNSSVDFIEFTDIYCTNLTFNGTEVQCDVFVYDLISCIEYSPCWYNISTTSYSDDCAYYASVTTNITITTELTEYEVCFAPWDAYFAALFGDTYVTVDVGFLYNNCTYNWTDFYWNYSAPVLTENITVSFQLTLYFYSEYSYYDFVGVLNGTTIGNLFGNGSFLNATWLDVVTFNTYCCLYYSDGYGPFDAICAASIPSTSEGSGNGGGSSGGGSGNGGGKTSSASSINPFNFIIISIALISAYVF